MCEVKKERRMMSYPGRSVGNHQDIVARGLANESKVDRDVPSRDLVESIIVEKLQRRCTQ